jgi:hypothetical protein
MFILSLIKVKSIPIDNETHYHHSNPKGSGRLQVEIRALVV